MACTVLRARNMNFEVRDVVFFLRIDHQKFMLCARSTVQTIAAVEHEDLETGHTVLLDELRDLLNLPTIQRSEMESVVDVKPPARNPENFGKQLKVPSAPVEVILSGTEVVQAR